MLLTDPLESQSRAKKMVLRTLRGAAGTRGVLEVTDRSTGIPVLFYDGAPDHLSYTIFPPQIVYRTGAYSVHPANGELTAREAK